MHGTMIFRLCIVLLISVPAFGHSGGKDALGCHKDNWLGGYHCHNSDYEPPVKQSKSMICHTKESPYYKKTKNFTPFDDLDSCLEKNGRLPKK